MADNTPEQNIPSYMYQPPRVVRDRLRQQALQQGQLPQQPLQPQQPQPLQSQPQQPQSQPQPLPQQIKYQDPYRKYTQEGSKIGKMMLIEQGIFQGGTLFLAVVILVAYSVYMILTTGVETQEFVKTITEGPVVQFVLYLTSAIMQLVAGVVIVVFAARNKDAVRNAPLECGHLSFGLIMIGLFYILAVNSVVTGYNCLWAFITDSVDYVNPLFAGSYKWPVFLLVSVFPAIVEELLYRGILFRYLRQHGFMYAAVVTGFVFGLIHMNLQQFFFAGTMGFVLCYVYERSGHIWPCMLLHFTNNALATLLEMSDHKADIALLLIWLGFNMFVSLILLVIFDLRGRFRYDSRIVTKTLTATPMLILIIIGICLCLTNVFL